MNVNFSNFRRSISLFQFMWCDERPRSTSFVELYIIAHSNNWLEGWYNQKSEEAPYYTQNSPYKSATATEMA